jgi:uncharacterized protein YndB with AHSA1/START domain/DNA-binding transcriptional ArsR family regulator
MNEDALSRILKAAGDTTRRQILTLLVQEGALRVTALAAHFDMSLNSVSKHIKVLEEAGLVTRRTLGREHFIAAELEPLKLTEGWFAQLKSIWELRLRALETLLVTKEEQMTELELTVSHTIAAPRDKVFNAWLTPTLLSQFMLPEGGMKHAEVSNEPKKGGRFSILMKTATREIPHGGTYLAIDPYSHLSFTWQSPHSVDDSVVTIDFAEPKPGTTEVTLKQVKFTSEQSRLGHIGGWTAIMEALEELFVKA